MTETKRLLLLRHAKSSWDHPSLADRDRPLAPRGRKAAQRIKAYLNRKQIPVALVLCSPARRARETLELVAPPGEVVIEDELYGATAAELLERLCRLSDQVDAVMLIRHEPAIRELAVGLLERGTSVAKPQRCCVVESAHARERTEVVIERAVFLHHEDDVLDVGDRAGITGCADRQRTLDRRRE